MIISPFICLLFYLSASSLSPPTLSPFCYCDKGLKQSLAQYVTPWCSSGAAGRKDLLYVCNLRQQPLEPRLSWVADSLGRGIKGALVLQELIDTVRATAGLVELLLFPWLPLPSHWTRRSVSLSLDVSFSLFLFFSPLSHTQTHCRNSLTLWDFTYFSVSLSSPQTSVLDKRQLKGNLNLKQGPQQKHAAPKWRNFRRLGASYWVLAVLAEKAK